MSNALLCFFLTAKRDESLALEVENVLFADELRRSERAAGQNVGELAAHVRVVFRGVAASEHHVDGELGSGEELFAKHFDLGGLRAFVPGCSQGLVATAHERES